MFRIVSPRNTGIAGGGLSLIWFALDRLAPDLPNWITLGILWLGVALLLFSVIQAAIGDREESSPPTIPKTAGLEPNVEYVQQPIIDMIKKALTPIELRALPEKAAGPIRDRTSVTSAALYMVFKDWHHTLADLTPDDRLRLLSGNFARIVQEAIDDQLTIWVRQFRHSENYIKMEPDYWHTSGIHVEDALRGEPQTWSTLGALNAYYDPLVRKSDIERLFGGDDERD